MKTALKKENKKKHPCPECGQVPESYMNRGDCWYVKCKCWNVGGTQFQYEAWDKYFYLTKE